MIYLTNINLNQNQLQNAIIQPLAVAPSSPKLGQIYCDSVNFRIMWYNGTTWKTIGVVVESSQTNGAIVVDGVPMTVYTLPTASASTLGGIKVGSNLTIDENGVLSTTANQNAFSNVIVGGTTIGAASETDNLTFEAGTNVTITPDSLTKKLTISATDTTYTNVSEFTNDAGYLVATDNIASANKLATARTITVTGDATGSLSFDGSQNVSMDLTVVDDSHNHTISNVTGLESALAEKAPLESPVFTGSPSAPTPNTGDNSTKIATTAFVANKIDTTVQALEAHVNAGTISGTGVIQSVNSNVVSQAVTLGITFLSGLTDYEAGWEFRVTTAGTISDVGVVQSGDWVVCIGNYNSAYSADDWTIIQTNIDITDSVSNDDTKVPTSGAVYEYAQPASSELSAVASLTGTGILRRTGINTWTLGVALSTAEIADKAVTNAKLADMAAGTIKGNISATSGAPTDVTLSQLRTAMGVVGGLVSSIDTISAGSTSKVITKEGVITNVFMYDTTTGEQLLADVTMSNAGKTVTINLSAHTNAINVICNYVGA